MNSLVSLTVVVWSVALVFVGSRSASLPEVVDKKDPGSQNVIVFEIPSDERPGAGKVPVEGDKTFLEGKEFNSLKEMMNILDDDKKEKSSDTETTPEPFNIVVPVARNFSSLKELFEILSEDNHKTVSATNLTYVNETETKDQEYTIFFTA